MLHPLTFAIFSFYPLSMFSHDSWIHNPCLSPLWDFFLLLLASFLLPTQSCFLFSIIPPCHIITPSSFLVHYLSTLTTSKQASIFNHKLLRQDILRCCSYLLQELLCEGQNFYLRLMETKLEHICCMEFVSELIYLVSKPNGIVFFHLSWRETDCSSLH